MIELLLVIVLILISLFVILKGADYLVDGASDFARWLKVSPILVGLTIVAFGTSLPEFIVSLFAAVNGSPDLSIGNIIGSNIFNILVIIGISAFFVPLPVRSRTLIYELPFLIISAFLLLILGMNWFIFQEPSFSLTRFDGIIFLLILGFFLLYVFTTAREEQKNVRKQFTAEYKNKNPLWKNSVLIIGGLAALIIGGRIFVMNAEKLAELAGISEAFIGLTIAALGTSLPELATSAVAAWKKESDIAIGNIVGSNIFNILFVLGITSLIKPIPVNPTMLATDGIVMVVASLLFLVFATRDRKVVRWEGIVLVACYLAYFGWLVWGL